MKKLLIVAFATIYCGNLFAITPVGTVQSLQTGRNEIVDAQAWAEANNLTDEDKAYILKNAKLVAGPKNYSYAGNKTKNVQKITVWNGASKPLFVAVYEEYNGKKPKLFGTIYKVDSLSEIELQRPEWTGGERRTSGNNRSLYFSDSISGFGENYQPEKFFNIGEGLSGTNKFMIYWLNDFGNKDFYSADLESGAFEKLEGGEYDASDATRIKNSKAMREKAKASKSK